MGRGRGGIGPLVRDAASWNPPAERDTRSDFHKTNEFTPYAGPRSFSEYAVQRAKRGAMIGADGEMQRIAGTQAKLVAVGKTGGGVELETGNRKQGEALPGRAARRRPARRRDWWP